MIEKSKKINLNIEIGWGKFLILFNTKLFNLK